MDLQASCRFGVYMKQIQTSIPKILHSNNRAMMIVPMENYARHGGCAMYI